MEHCDSQNEFGENQSAYRGQRCTTDDFNKLTQYASEAFQWSQMIGAVCLDVEKAFVVVWRLELKLEIKFVHKLNSIGLNNSVIKRINSFLLQRNVSCTENFHCQ